MFSWKFYGILLAFFIVGVVSFAFPIASALDFLQAVHSQAASIAFDKGAYYASGAGILFTIGPLWILYILYREKRGKNPTSLTPAQTRRVQRMVYIFFAVCLATTFFLPQIVSNGVGKYLTKQGYTYCVKQSQQWLLARTMVYTKSHCD